MHEGAGQFASPQVVVKRYWNGSWAALDLLGPLYTAYSSLGPNLARLANNTLVLAYTNAQEVQVNVNVGCGGLAAAHELPPLRVPACLLGCCPPGVRR